MPGGPVTASTLAVSNVPSPAYLGPFELPNTALLTGTNVLAVELHAAASGITNVLFGAALGTDDDQPAGAPAVSARVQRDLLGHEWRLLDRVDQLRSDTLDLCRLRAVAIAAPRANHDFIFPSQTLASGALVHFWPQALGFGAATGRPPVPLPSWRQQRVGRGRGQGRTARPLAGRHRPLVVSHRRHSGASNFFVFHRGVVINEIMYHPPSLPAAPATLRHEHPDQHHQRLEVSQPGRGSGQRVALAGLRRQHLAGRTVPVLQHHFRAAGSQEHGAAADQRRWHADHHLVFPRRRSCSRARRTARS